MFPDRKKPCLCIEEEGKAKIVVYGHFNTVDGAEEFMTALGKLVGAVFEEGGAEDGAV